MKRLSMLLITLTLWYSVGVINYGLVLAHEQYGDIAWAGFACPLDQWQACLVFLTGPLGLPTVVYVLLTGQGYQGLRWACLTPEELLAHPLCQADQWCVARAARLSASRGVP